MGYKFPNVILSGLKQTTNAEMWLKIHFNSFSAEDCKTTDRVFRFHCEV